MPGAGRAPRPPTPRNANIRAIPTANRPPLPNTTLAGRPASMGRQQAVAVAMGAAAVMAMVVVVAAAVGAAMVAVGTVVATAAQATGTSS